MILQGPDTWGCTTSRNDKIGVYTTTASIPSTGWQRGDRIGYCDYAGHYSTWGVGGVMTSVNSNAPYFLTVDRGIVTEPGVNPDTEKHFIFIWESDDGISWRNEHLLIDSSAVSPGRATLRSAPFRISSTSYYGSTRKTYLMGMFFNIGLNNRSDVNVGYAYVEIDYPGPGGTSTYQVYVLAEDDTYHELPSDGKMDFLPKLIMTPEINRIIPNHSEVVEYYPGAMGVLWATKPILQSQSYGCCATAGTRTSEIRTYDWYVDEYGQLTFLDSVGSLVAESLPDFCNPHADYHGVYYPMTYPPERWMSGTRYSFVDVDDTCDHTGWGPFKIRLLTYAW
jgi:hypothetical protein